MIADIEGDYNDLMHGDTPEVVPVLPVRNLVLFPSVVSPILIGRESSKLLIQQAERKHFVIGRLCQGGENVDIAQWEHYRHRTGTRPTEDRTDAETDTLYGVSGKSA